MQGPENALQDRLSANPLDVIGPSFFSPDQQAFRQNARDFGRGSPHAGEMNATRIAQSDSGLTTVTDMDPAADAWLDPGGGYGELWALSPGLVV